MKKKVVLILCLLILYSCGDSFKIQIEKLFSTYQGNVPGAAVMIIKDGEKIYQNSFGLADVEKQIPVKLNTNFRLASVTKQFTAMCIMMLVERGKLSYEQTLKDIFNDFPEYGKEITIKHLLQHTSGLVAYEDLIPDTATVQVLDKDVLEMMKTQDTTYFSPGSQYRYSNSAYAVLAMIIEKISRETFAQFLQENIFTPLNMEHTVAYENGISTIEYRAFGYAFEDSQFVFKDQSVTSAVLGDGGIYSSVNDLYLWDQALYTDKLVSFSTLQAAFTSGKLTNGESIEYGFGWYVKNYKNKRCIYHTGSSCGFRNVIQRFPDERLTIVVLTNRDEPDLKNLADQISDLYL